MSFEKLLQLAQEKFHIGIALAITNRNRSYYESGKLILLRKRVSSPQINKNIINGCNFVANWSSY